MLLTIVQ